MDVTVPYRYIAVGWIDWAAIQLEEIAAGGAEDGEILTVLGLAYESLGEYEKALATYERASSAFADAPEWIARVEALAGSLHLRLGKLEEARAALTLSDQLLPGQALVMMGLGQLDLREERYESARRWFESAIEVSPQWVDPATLAASIYIESGEPLKAVTLLHPYQGLASRNPEYHHQLAIAYAKLARRIVEAGPSQHIEEALRSVGIQGADIAGVLRDLASHALDRTLQLDPERSGLEAVLEAL